MGRFSDMVGGREAQVSPMAPSGYVGTSPKALLANAIPQPAQASEKSLWMVFNGHLESHSKGLRFRRTPDLKDTSGVRRKLAEFGETVEGIPTGDGWLKTGRYYLPMEVQGVPVLIPANPSERDDANQGVDPAAMWQNWKLPKPLERRPEELGTGVLYEVVHDRIVGRPAPSLAAPKQALRNRGDVIELFEFDETRKWRKGLEDRTFHMVWWMIDHPELGPLLRPQGQPLSVKPVDPLCVAAREDLSQDLQRFLDEGSEANVYDVSGRTALMLAAEQGHLDCCVLLVEGGADPTLKSRGAPRGKTAVELADSVQTKSLLKAICGYKEFEMRQFDKAVQQLRPENAETAERLFEAAMRAVYQGAFLVEGQEHAAPLPKALPAAAEPLAAAEAPRPRGVLHEVAYNAVWIRREPDVNAAKISVKKEGELVEVFDVDETGDWAHVEHEVYAGHFVPGWMMLRHEKLGELLRPTAAAEPGPTASPILPTDHRGDLVRLE